MEYIALGALGVMGIMGYGAYSVFNRLGALDERCKSAFADIDVLLKHRHTLIPGLVESVKGFVGQERDILTMIAQARTNALQAANPEELLMAEAELSDKLISMVTMAENYPELQSSSHFQQFRAELVDVENRVTASRRFYNLTVSEFNATRRQFPGNILAAKMGLPERQAFDLGMERMLMDEPVSIKF